MRERGGPDRAAAIPGAGRGDAPSETLLLILHGHTSADPVGMWFYPDSDAGRSFLLRRRAQLRADFPVRATTVWCRADDLAE